MSLKFIKNIHSTYSGLIKYRQSLGNKKLVTIWKDSSNGKDCGQFFESKVLKNGNTKTRMLTIYPGKSTAIGLETKVTRPDGSVAYQTAGLLKKVVSHSHFRQKITSLEQKAENGTISKIEKEILKQMKTLRNKLTKIYESGAGVSKARRLLYKDQPKAKTLKDKTYWTYNN